MASAICCMLEAFGLLLAWHLGIHMSIILPAVGAQPGSEALGASFNATTTAVDATSGTGSGPIDTGAAGQPVVHDCSITLGHYIPGLDLDQTTSISCSGPTDAAITVSCWLQSQIMASGFENKGVRMQALGTGTNGTCTSADATLEDWHVTFRADGLGHLHLHDSTVYGLPLSLNGPLLSCDGYTDLSMTNVTFSTLQAPPSASVERPAFGAFSASNLNSASLNHFTCSNVHGAYGWACLLLMYSTGNVSLLVLPRISLDMRDSYIGNNSMTGSQFSTALLGKSIHPALQPLDSDSQAVDCATRSYGAIVLAQSESSSNSLTVEVKLAGGILENNAGGCGSVLASTMPVSNLNLQQINILTNNASGHGGAIYLGSLQSSTQISIGDSSVISGNAAYGQGGILATRGALVNITVTAKSALSNNVAMGGNGGGAIHAQGHCGVINVSDSSSVDGNQASTRGGGLSCDGGLDALQVSTNSSLNGNNAAMWGGAVFAGSDTTFTSITVTGGSIVSLNAVSGIQDAPAGSPPSGGGVIYSKGQLAHIVIQDQSMVTYNSVQAGGGGAILAYGSCGKVLSITNNSVVSKNFANWGGFLACSGSLESVEIAQNSILEGNTARSGDGGCIHASGNLANLTVYGNSSIDQNVASGNGGVLLVTGNIGIFNVTQGSSMSGNRAGDTGGVINAGGACLQVTISDSSTVSSNTANSAGAVHCSSGIRRLVLDGGSSIANNSANSNHGRAGAIQSQGGMDSLTISGSSMVTNNHAGDYGGAIYVAGNVATLLITGGSAVFGNAVYAWYGGAISITGTCGSVTISDRSAMNMNSGRRGGGALCCASGIDALLVTGESSMNNNNATGGALFVESGYLGSITISNGSSISGNRGGPGPAIYIKNADDCTAGNHASSITVSNNSSIADNYAEVPTAAFLEPCGGAVWMSCLASLVISDGSSITNNTAALNNNPSQLGGALYIDSSSAQTTISVIGNSIAAHNTADGGGFVYTHGSILALDVDNDSSVSWNMATESNGGAVLSTISAGAQCTTVSITARSEMSYNGATGEAAGSGGALWLPCMTSLLVAGESRVVNNTAYRDGGVVYLKSAGLTVPFVSLADGAAMTGNRAARGGGLFSNGAIGNISITGASTMEGNTGTALYSLAYECGHVTVTGGSNISSNARAPSLAAPLALNSIDIGTPALYCDVANGTTFLSSDSYAPDLTGDPALSPPLSIMPMPLSSPSLMPINSPPALGPQQAPQLSYPPPQAPGQHAPSSPATPAGTAKPHAASSSASSAPVGPIIGGVVGGVLVVAAVIAGLLLYRRRRAQQHPPNSSLKNTWPPQPQSQSPDAAPGLVQDSSQETQSTNIPGTSSSDFKVTVHHPGSPMSAVPGQHQPLLPQGLINANEVEIRDKLGSGAFGVVYKGVWRGAPVAIKVVDLNDVGPEDVARCKEEMLIMWRLRHPNIVQVYGMLTIPSGEIAIVMEMAARGSLCHLLHEAKTPIDPRRRLRMALDTAKGLEYLHGLRPPLVHRDIKSLNLLVAADWSIKVCDFGLSKLKPATYFSTCNVVGTPAYMAPEVLLGQPCNEKSDVYSYGMVLYELVTGRMPWSEYENPFVLAVVVGDQGQRPELPSSMDPTVAMLIDSCWEQAPEARPSITDVLGTLKGMAQLDLAR